MMMGQSRHVNQRTSKRLNRLGRFHPPDCISVCAARSSTARLCDRSLNNFIRLGLGAGLRALVLRDRSAQGGCSVLRSIRPKVAGSNPAGHASSKQRHATAGCDKYLSFTAPNTSSSQAHPSLSSRQDAADSGGFRSETATQNATTHCVVADSDLAVVVDSWPVLPEAIKVGIVAMIQAWRVPCREPGR
jgi:hypothetical protein